MREREGSARDSEIERKREGRERDIFDEFYMR